MQKTATRAKSSSSYTRPALQKSTTLSRKYVRRPVATKKVLDIKKPVAAKKKVKVLDVKGPVKKTTSVKKSTAPEVAVRKAVKSPAAKVTAKKAAASSPKVRKIVANKSQNKTAAVKRATRVAPKSSADAKAAAADAARAAMKRVATMESVKPMKKRRGLKALIALGLSTAVVTVLGIFVVINLPNISVKVVAIQTGIEATYPTFVPRGYSLETVASDKGGKITMKFVGPNDTSFTLIEENSTWDSNAVLNNYVKENYSANYSTMHEQGITYYSDPGTAVWVNGGILYKISSFGKNLSREQIRNLVVSL